MTIAGISTKELVLKDFATEADEVKLRNAGMLMSQKLAGSLALVTCKEPLKSNLTAHIRANLVETGIAEVRDRFCHIPTTVLIRLTAYNVGPGHCSSGAR